jgi:hypothetical protein
VLMHCFASSFIVVDSRLVWFLIKIELYALTD